MILLGRIGLRDTGVCLHLSSIDFGLGFVDSGLDQCLRTKIEDSILQRRQLLLGLLHFVLLCSLQKNGSL